MTSTAAISWATRVSTVGKIANHKPAQADDRHRLAKIANVANNVRRQNHNHLLALFVFFAFLLLWWVFLYGYVVGPWQFVHRDELIFGIRYDFLYSIENLFVVVAFAVLWIRTAFSWKRIYGHLLVASLLYGVASLLINVAIDRKTYHTGSLYDVPLIASMAWFAYAGYVASRSQLEREPALLPLQKQTYWHSRLSALALFSMPLFTLWAAIDSGVGPAIQRYRDGKVRTATAGAMGGGGGGGGESGGAGTPPASPTN